MKRTKMKKDFIKPWSTRVVIRLYTYPGYTTSLISKFVSSLKVSIVKKIINQEKNVLWKYRTCSDEINDME